MTLHPLPGSTRCLRTLPSRCSPSPRTRPGSPGKLTSGSGGAAGTRHPAKLNFGDCFSYALAQATGEPLLFKGDDFSATDGIGFAAPLA